MLRPDEVTQAIKKEIQKYENKLSLESIGYVLQVGDGIARIYGLDQVMASELITFQDGTMGLALNLEPDNVAAIPNRKMMGNEKASVSSEAGRRSFELCLGSMSIFCARSWPLKRISEPKLAICMPSFNHLIWDG